MQREDANPRAAYCADTARTDAMDTTERSTTFITRWPLVACLALVVAVPGWAAAQSPFSGIVVFGTSLSDPGNAFALVGAANTPHDFDLTGVQADLSSVVMLTRLDSEDVPSPIIIERELPIHGASR